MYEEYYGLSGPAFGPEADIDFFFPALAMRKAMTTIGQGLNRGGGIVLVTGAPGSGKTMLLLHLRERLSAEPLSLALLSAAVAGEGGLIAGTAHAFGVELDAGEDAGPLAALDRFLEERARGGERVVLLLDDADALDEEGLAALQSLARLRLGERPLLQMVLAGNAPIEKRVERAGGLDDFRARLAAICRLETLMADEMVPFLEARLRQVGWDHHPEIDSTVAARLHRAAGGNPALIGQAMTRLLWSAAEDQQPVLGGDQLRAVILDMPGLDDPGEAPVEDTASDANAFDEQSVQPESEGEPAMVQASEIQSGLGEAQIRAIEDAFEQRDRLTVRLRRDLESLREEAGPAGERDARLARIDERLDEQERILRHLLARMIAFFEAEPPAERID